MDSQTTFVTLSALALSYALYKRYKRTSLDHIPGPAPESFLLGNLRQLLQSQVGEIEFQWQEQFGGVIRLKAPLGENRLLVSDPKALQYIFHTSGYEYKKEPERKVVSRLLSGRGLLWVEGEAHRKQKRIMLPAFGASESKAFLPLFRACAEKVTSQWSDVISSSNDQSAVFNVHVWLVRATLDAIGGAAFDYNFGAMDNAENELGKSYNNLLAGLFGSPSTAAVFVQAIARYIPIWILDLLIDHAPSHKIQRARDTGVLATGIAKKLIDEKNKAIAGGNANRDVMTLMLTSNASQNQREKMEEEEILAQMRTLMLAGHETTANTLSWTLYELAKRPEIQKKLREEIWATEQAHGPDLTAKDFDAMPYTTAIMKEVLRFHPVAYASYRQTSRDDILPMSRPMIKTNGEVVTEITVPKGTKVILSIAGYNRDKHVWGKDAHEFRPERWLDGSIEKSSSTVNIGVYGNMPTFSGGVRSCLGWRFAVVELQTFLVELVGKFEFSLTPETAKVRREACLAMVPTLDGEVEKGAHMPLRVSSAVKD